MPHACRFLPSVALALTALAGPAHAGTIHVPGDQPSIQQAIVAASDGDAILVAAGTWTGAIDFLGKQITLQSEAGTDLTTIDGGLGSVITLANGEPEGTVLRGFTVTGGTGQLTQVWTSGPIWRAGGGLFMTNHAHLQARECRFTGHDLAIGPEGSVGAGVFVRGAQASFTDCELSWNHAGDGPAAYGSGAEGSGLSLAHCSITANKGSTAVYGTSSVEDCLFQGNAGTAMHAEQSASRCAFIDNSEEGIIISGPAALPITVSDCAFAGNGGTGLYLSPSIGAGPVNCTMTSCVFSGGDGIYAYGSLLTLFSGADTLRIEHCTFDGGVIQMDFHAPEKQLVATNSILRNVTLLLPAGTAKVFDHCDVTGGAPGAGNIDADPLWVDPSVDAYELAPGSPCINTGSPSSPLDPDGSPADMGALTYDPWTDLGGDIAGASGAAALHGAGSMLPGSTLVVSMSGAPALQETVLILGAHALGVPFKSGTMWPSQDVVLTGVVTGSDGSWSLTGTLPASSPSGGSVWLQAFFLDASAPQGIAGTNGLRATSP